MTFPRGEDVSEWAVTYGTLAQYTRVKEHQLLPKAGHLSWEEAAASTMVGASAYRMLFGWAGNTAVEGETIVVCDGASGIASQAIQLARLAGSIPVATVSGAEEGEFAMACGAKGYIDRNDFTHWDLSPFAEKFDEREEWRENVARLRRTLWKVSGVRRDPILTIDRLGSSTISTSSAICSPGGMIVIHGDFAVGSGTINLTDHFAQQKRLQGSRGATVAQAIAYNSLILDRKIDPCIGHVGKFQEVPDVHCLVSTGRSEFGNAVILIGAREQGLGRSF